MKSTTNNLVSAIVAVAMVLSGSAHAAVPVLNGGWLDEEISAAGTDSVSSPYNLNLDAAAWFSLTDAFFFGDTFFVYDFGSLILTTSQAAGTPFAPTNGFADPAWEGGSYSIGSVLLAAGVHKITVQGDGGGGLPAGFYTRLDSATSAVPEGGSTLAMMGVGLVGMTALRRHLKKPAKA